MSVLTHLRGSLRRYLNTRKRWRERTCYTWDRWEHTRSVQRARHRLWQ